MIMFKKSRAGLMASLLHGFDRPPFVVDREKKNANSRIGEIQLVYNYCGEPYRQA
jgi:hypothetical protein